VQKIERKEKKKRTHFHPKKKKGKSANRIENTIGRNCYLLQTTLGCFL